MDKTQLLSLAQQYGTPSFVFDTVMLEKRMREIKEIVGEKVDRTHGGSVLSLTVNAYAVQSANNPADHPWDAAGWPADLEVAE